MRRLEDRIEQLERQAPERFIEPPEWENLRQEYGVLFLPLMKMFCVPSHVEIAEFCHHLPQGWHFIHMDGNEL